MCVVQRRRSPISPVKVCFWAMGKNKSPELQINDLKGRLVTANHVLVVTAAVRLWSRRIKEKTKRGKNMCRSHGAASICPPPFADAALLRAATLVVPPPRKIWLTRSEGTWVQFAVGTVGTRHFYVYLKWSVQEFTYRMCSFESNVA